VGLEPVSSRAASRSARSPCVWVMPCFFGNVVLMPLWLQSNLGYTATWAGLVSAPSGITAILASMMMGRLMHRFDPRVLAASSFAFFALSYFNARASSRPTRANLVFVLPQLVQGPGDGHVLHRDARGVFRSLAGAQGALRLGPVEFCLRIHRGRFRHPRSSPPSGTGAKRCISPSWRMS